MTDTNKTPYKTVLEWLRQVDPIMYHKWIEMRAQQKRDNSLKFYHLHKSKKALAEKEKLNKPKRNRKKK